MVECQPNFFQVLYATVYLYSKNQTFIFQHWGSGHGCRLNFSKYFQLKNDEIPTKTSKLKKTRKMCSDIGSENMHTIFRKDRSIGTISPFLEQILPSICRRSASIILQDTEQCISVACRIIHCLIVVSISCLIWNRTEFHLVPNRTKTDWVYSNRNRYLFSTSSTKRNTWKQIRALTEYHQYFVMGAL